MVDGKDLNGYRSTLVVLKLCKSDGNFTREEININKLNIVGRSSDLPRAEKCKKGQGKHSTKKGGHEG